MDPAGGATIRALLREAAERIQAIDAGNPRLEAEYLLSHALSIERPTLLTRDPGMVLDLAGRERFAVLLARRLHREPLQYVLGTVPFAGLNLVIGPGALIPRGETEILVQEVADALGARSPQSALPRKTPARVLVDVGTGSGAILLALLGRLPSWRGIGIDRSPAALTWARRNIVMGAAPSGHLVRADLLAAVRTGAVDAVVSNPPYVRTGEIAGLAPEIREHEPPEALDGGEDGLDPFRLLIPEVVRVLRSGGLLAVELAPDQPGRAAELLAASGAFPEVRVFRDLAGRTRGLLARRL